LAATALADVTAPIARALPRVGSVLWRLVSTPVGEEEAELAPVGDGPAESVFAPADRPGFGPPEPLGSPSEAVLGPPEPVAIPHYGTTLALELLPHFTDGRIASMEGLYFESAATTPYHFLTVSALAKQPSNPVRSMAPYYKTLSDFELGVAQMRLLGVNYYMAQSPEAKAKADASPGL